MDTQQDRTSREARDRRFRIVAMGSLVCALIAGILAFTIPAVAQTGTGTSDGDREAESSPAGRTTVESTVTERLNAALEPLVTEGTITAEQRDAVVEALLSARRELTAADGHGRHHGEGNREMCVAALKAHVTARVNGEQPGDDADLSNCGGRQSKRRHGPGRWGPLSASVSG